MLLHNIKSVPIQISNNLTMYKNKIQKIAKQQGNDFKLEGEDNKKEEDNDGKKDDSPSLTNYDSLR